MRALTGVLKYVGIVLLASVLIVAFTIGVMFFVPSVSIFGFYFRQTIKSDIVIYSGSTINNFGLANDAVITLNIEAGNYHVAVIPKNIDHIEIETNNNYIGLVKATTVTKENKNLFADKYLGMRDAKGQLTTTEEAAKENNYKENPNYVEKVELNQKLCVVNPYVQVKDTENANEYTYVVKEPQGLMSRNASNVIVFYVPVRAALNNNTEDTSDDSTTEIKYNINIATNNGDIRLKNSTKMDSDVLQDFLYLNELSIETNKGGASLEGVKTDGSGAAIVEDKKERKVTMPTRLILPSLNIKTNGGTFDFSNYNQVIVNGKVKLESEKANYKFNELKSYYNGGEGEIEISGTNVEFVANKVYCGKDGFSFKSDTGMLKVDKLYTGQFRSVKDKENKPMECATDIAYLYSEADSPALVNNEYFTDVLTPYENTIFTNSAVIELGTVVGKLGLQNELGSVKIGHLSHQATIRTENGNIDIQTSGYLLDTRSAKTKKAWNDNVANLGGYVYDQEENKVFTSTSSLILYSTYGDINVGEYYQDAVMHSKKGQIKAYSKFSGIKNGNEELLFDKGEKKTAYCGFEKDEDGNNKGELKWWRSVASVDGKNYYSNEITQDYILVQLAESGEGGTEGTSGEYYSDPSCVAVAYFQDLGDGNTNWFKDSAYTIKITESYILDQVNAKTEKQNNKVTYFVKANQSQARYYYTDVTTKDGTVNITTDKNPVRIIASDRTTINLTVTAVMSTNDVLTLKDPGVTSNGSPIEMDYMTYLNPFGNDDYMYIAETKNGTVNVVLPITSYIIQVNCKNVEGTIGATSNVGEYNSDTKTRPEIQINSSRLYQPKIRLAGKKAILSSDI